MVEWLIALMKLIAVCAGAGAGAGVIMGAIDVLEETCAGVCGRMTI